jgi:hypothetical protein
MAKLTADEKKLLDELAAKEAADEDDDFEIEVYDTTAGRGARLPMSQGRKWLFDNLGIGDDPNPPEDKKTAAKKTAGKDDDSPVVRTGYFNRQAG